MVKDVIEQFPYLTKQEYVSIITFIYYTIYTIYILIKIYCTYCVIRL